MSGPGLLWDPCLGSGSDAAVVSLDVTPDTTKGLEDRAVDSNTGGNCSCPSLAEDSGDDPIPLLGCTIELTIFAGTQVNGFEGLRMGEQVMSLSHAIWWHEWGKDSLFSLAPHHLQQVRNLTQPLTSCITEESRPCTSTGQHNRVNPVGGVVEPAPKLLPQESCPHYSSVLWLHGGERCLPPHFEPKSWSCPSSAAALGRVAPTPRLGNTSPPWRCRCGRTDSEDMKVL